MTPNSSNDGEGCTVADRDTDPSEQAPAFGPILVPTDFSPDADAALVWAGRFAARIDAPIVVLHVVHDPAEAAGFYQAEGAAALEPLTEVAGQMMEEYIAHMQSAHPDLPGLQTATTQLVAGLPAGRIVEAAEREGAQLIVIGSKGRTGLSHILVGSVAERVVRLAPMPVVVVKRPVAE